MTILAAKSPRAPRARLAAVVVAATAVLAAGCGNNSNSKTSNLPPNQAVDSAVSKLGSQSSLEARISVGVTAAQIQQMAAKDNSGSGPTPAEAKAISTGSIFLMMQTGHGEALDSAQAASDKDDSSDIGLQIGSDVPVEIRTVAGTLYLRADIHQLLSDIGQNPSKASQVDSFLNQANSVVPGASAIAQAKWVEVSQDSLQSLLSSLAQSQGGSAPNPSQLQQAARALLSDLESALKANSTYQSAGNSGGRSQYAVTLNVHNFITQVAPAIEKDLSSLPFGLGQKYSSTLTGPASAVPAGTMAKMDVYVQDDKVQEADLDINQFEHKYSFPVPVRVVFSSPGAITAPSGATKLDLSKVPALLQQMIGDKLGNGGNGSGDSTTTTPDNGGSNTTDTTDTTNTTDTGGSTSSSSDSTDTTTTSG